LLTERPVTQKDLVLLKWPTTTKQKLRSLPLTKLNWMAKRLWLKKPMTVKNVHAEIPTKEVVDTKAEAVAVAATRVEAVAVAVATNVVMTTVVAAVAVAETTTVAAVALVEKAAAVAVETVGNLKQKKLKSYQSIN
jgi:hypothetical protein